MRPHWLVVFALLFIGMAWTTGQRASALPAHVSRIVFSQGEKIWVLEGDGSNKRFLVRGESPEISPDGHWVAYYPCNACALFLINADGGPARRLARNFNPPIWSPDSRHLATHQSCRQTAALRRAADHHRSRYRQAAHHCGGSRVTWLQLFSRQHAADVRHQHLGRAPQ